MPLTNAVQCAASKPLRSVVSDNNPSLSHGNGPQRVSSLGPRCLTHPDRVRSQQRCWLLPSRFWAYLCHALPFCISDYFLPARVSSMSAFLFRHRLSPAPVSALSKIPSPPYPLCAVCEIRSLPLNPPVLFPHIKRSFIPELCLGRSVCPMFT